MKTKRFKNVDIICDYIITLDTLNSTYGVFIKATGFYQQVSKWYYSIGWCKRFIKNRMENKNAS